MPECSPADEHILPAFRRVLLLCASHCGVFAGYKSHALELWQYHFALEYAFPVDADPPFALRFASIGRLLRHRIRHLKRRFCLVEIPVQTGPQHHGDLARRRGGGLELIAAGIRYRGDVEVVAIESRSAVPAYLACGRPFLVLVYLFIVLLVINFLL